MKRLWLDYNCPECGGEALRLTGNGFDECHMCDGRGWVTEFEFELWQIIQNTKLAIRDCFKGAPDGEA